MSDPGDDHGHDDEGDDSDHDHEGDDHEHDDDDIDEQQQQQQHSDQASPNFQIGLTALLLPALKRQLLTF